MSAEKVDVRQDLAELIGLFDSRSDIDDFGEPNESMRIHAVLCEIDRAIAELARAAEAIRLDFQGELAVIAGLANLRAALARCQP